MARIACLERKLQAHLDATCIVPLGLGDKPAKVGRGRIDVDIVRVEERVIESVDELRAELQDLSFPNVGLFDDRQVGIVDVVTTQETEPDRERPHLPGGPLLIGRFHKACIRVEPPLNGPFV